MKNIIEVVTRWFKSLFNKKETIVPVQEVEPEEPKPVKKRKPGRRDKPENWVEGDYTSAKELLSDLQHRYDWLKGFKPKMSEGDLRVIKKIGIYMMPANTDMFLNIQSLDGGRDRVMPTYMSLGFYCKNVESMCRERKGIMNTNDMILVADKHKWKPNAYNVEKPKGKYFYTFGWVVKTGKAEYFPLRVALEVMKDGSIEILRMLDTRYVELPNKRRNEGGYFRKEWSKYYMPPSIKMEEDGTDDETGNEEHTKELFRLLYNVSMRLDASTSIHATKGGTRMKFTVPFGSWKDFFKDRITAYASDGKRKRIFHHVAAHTRSNGQTVPMHTRGLTRFKWNGFNIKICEWKRGRFSTNAFDITGEALTEAEIREAQGSGVKLCGADEISTMLIRHTTNDIHQPTKH